MFSIKCENCREQMIVSSFTKTVDKMKILRRAEVHYWLCKFVCPFCSFVTTLPIAKYVGDRYFRTQKNLTLWYFAIVKGKWEKGI